MSTQNVTIVVEAQDRASRRIKQVSQSLRKDLGSSIRSAGLSMLSFTAILSGVGLSITALVVKLRSFISNIMQTRRAVGVLTFQLQQSGFSADSVNRSIDRLRNNLSRLALQALSRVDAALRSMFFQLTPVSQKRLNDLADALAEFAGVAKDEAFEAALEAKAGNMEALNKLVPEVSDGFRDLGHAIGFFADQSALAVAQRTPFENFMGFLTQTFVTGVIDMFAQFGRDFASAFNAIAFALESDGAITGNAIRLGQFLGTNIKDGVLGFFSDPKNIALLGLSMLVAIGTGVLGQVAEFLKWGVRIGEWIWAGLKTFWGEVVPGALSQTLKDSIRGGILPVMDWIESRGRQIGLRIWEGLKSIKDLLIDVGKSIPEWIWQGIQASASAFWSRLNSFIDRIRSALSFIPGISAPSGGPASFSGGIGSSPTSNRPRINSQPLVVQLGEKTFARAVVESVDGSMRLKAPGLGAV